MRLFSIFTIAATAILSIHTDAFAPTTSSSRVSHTLRTSSPVIPRHYFRTNDREANLKNGHGLKLSQENNEVQSQSNGGGGGLPVFLDPGTKGGAIVLSLILFIIPLLIYQISTSLLGYDEITTGRNIGVGFSVFTMLLWGSTYIFRVATKDMTYAKQLKDYEDAVIQKRLEELDEDEVLALVEDIEREEF